MTPEQSALFDKLTRLQRRVCIAFLKPGATARGAYYEAGGTAKTPSSADTSVSEIMSKPQVRAFLDEMAKTAVRNAIMEKEEAMEILSRQARTSLSDLVEWARYPIASSMETGEVTEWQTGWRIKPSVEQDPEKMALISELTAGKEGIKIKTHSQREALQLLGKFRGWEAPTKVAATNGAGEDVAMPTVIRLVGPAE
jgi:phage terminase small subunit